MRRALLTQKSGVSITYPLLLDNFESGTLAKWNNGSAAFTTSSSAAIQGTYSAYALSSNGNSNSYPDGRWLTAPPVGYSPSRGDIVSFLARIETAGEKLGIALHCGVDSSVPSHTPINGYGVLYDGSYLQLYWYNAIHESTMLANIYYPLTTFSEVFKISVYVNPLTHPTNPGLFSATVSKYDGTVVGTATATVTGSFDYNGSNIGMLGQLAVKGGTAIWRWDNFTVEGRT
jgi:hypothetical protein